MLATVASGGAGRPSPGWRAGIQEKKVCFSDNMRLTVLPFVIEQGFCAGGAQPPCQGLSGSKTHRLRYAAVGRKAKE